MKIINAKFEEKQNFLGKAYKGDIIRISELLFKTIEITDFELKPSKFNQNTLTMYAQIRFINDQGQPEERMLVTEARKIIEYVTNKIDEKTKQEGFKMYGKVIKDQVHNYYFLSTPSNIEKLKFK